MFTCGGAARGVFIRRLRTRFRKAQQAVKKHRQAPPPKHLLNAPTPWMKEQGYGAGYRYPHDEPGGVAQGVRYLPEALEGERFYEPTDRGYEAYVKERLREWRQGS